MTTFMTYKKERDSLRQQLAASQAYAQQLRDTLEFFFPDWKNYNSLSWRHEVKEALSTQSDTTALEAMITKAGEVMRESVIEQCIAMGAMSRDGAFVEEIRALPSVTLEDLK